MALKQGKSIPLQEDIDPDYEPSAEEIADYAQWLGLDLESEKELVWICREGLKAKLPADWKAFRTADDGEVYYYNATSGDSSWEHPCDERFMKLYADEKAKLLSRRNSKDQAKSASAQAGKSKPGVLPPLQLAPLSAKAPLPPLNKLSSQPLQAPALSQASSSAPAGANSAQRPGNRAVTQGGPFSSSPTLSMPTGSGPAQASSSQPAVSTTAGSVNSLGRESQEGLDSLGLRSNSQRRSVTADQDTEAALQQARADSKGRLAAMQRELLAAEDAERAELEKEYKGRLTALQSELTKQENQAKQQSAARLQSMTAEAARMEAAALEEGEARCATVQAQNLSKLAVLQDEHHSSERHLAELQQQLDTQQARLQSQIGDLTLQQEQQQQQQQKIWQQALLALQASIEEELRPQRKQLREQALAAMESEVTSSLQGQREQMKDDAISHMQEDIAKEVLARRKQLQDAALVAMRSEVVAEITKLRSQELEQAQQELRQQLQQQVAEEQQHQLAQVRSELADRLLLNRQRLEEEHATLVEAQAQESRSRAQEALRADEGRWLEEERKLMERRVKHQVQAEEAALLAVDMAAAERRMHSALDAHISDLRQQVESEERAKLTSEVQRQVAEEKAGKLSEARTQMEQQVAAAVAQEGASQAKLNSAAHAEPSRTERDSAAEADAQVQSIEEQAAESQGRLLGEVRGFMRMARDGIKQRQSALQYARSTWQACLNERPSEGLGEVLGGLRGVMEAEALQLNSETKALHDLKVHVKAMEKGHPLATSKAAWNSPSSPYTPGPTLQTPSASQQPYPMMQSGMPGMQSLVMGMQAGVPRMAWGGCGSLDAAKAYSPRGYSGLDGVGQALSAALQACESRRYGTGLQPVAPAWAIPSYHSTPRAMHTPAHMVTSPSHLHASPQARPDSAQEVIQKHSRWLRTFNAQMYT
ncbi:hypothetical protein WJX79_002482 [Trebouxia sp. C0005]